ncbi:MAG: hypothetical protein JST89_08960 [Cyanobacteria bacterium SZAS-4]|nr:hypothetical protein [Cyanobacteria bacterium SZAS-4]
MRQRRRTGATLGLVAICILVIAVLGVGAYFIVKLMGGGREVANATDAGVLNVAKHAIRDARVATPAGYEDCEYPLGCGYINLLTYNRCVARAIMVASNAAAMTGSGPYKANAQKALADLDSAGRLLAQQIVDTNKYFNQVSNSTRMASLVGVKDSGPCVTAFMKPNGSTNVFFSAGQLDNFSVPLSTGSVTPKNASNYAVGAQTYMAGYAPIQLLGQTIYGVPVFPQQNPHLVSYLDFNSAKATFGSAPPNAVQLGSSTKEMRTELIMGALACAIVGATEAGGAGAGGSTVGTSLLGSGFQFPAAASYGYLEFGNYPANAAPPGYEPSDYSNNIFNHELFTEPNFLALADNVNASETSHYVTFGVNSEDVTKLVVWAYEDMKAEAAQKQNASNPTGPQVAVNFPTFPITTTSVWTGAQTLTTEIPAGQRPTPTQREDLARNFIGLLASPGRGIDSGMLNVCWCTQQLKDKIGLRGACVAALPDMQRAYGHDIPWTNRGGSQDFSQADWAKAKMLTDFEGVSPQNQGGYTNFSDVNLTETQSSGLGVYPVDLVNGQVPANPISMPSPPYTLPLQRPGTIYQLIRAVQSDDCLAETLRSITQRCKQIQPNTTDDDVMKLLDSRPGSLLPMATHGGLPNWDNARKLYIYLPGGDLSRKLVVSPVEPPKITHNMPDGCCTTPNNSNACYRNRYNINGNIVDAVGDQKVDDRPYVQIAGDMHVTDHADWQPGTGADNNFGRMTFEEIGIGDSHYTQIN